MHETASQLTEAIAKRITTSDLHDKALDLRDAAAEDEEWRAGARARHGEATRRNLGLGQDGRAV